MLGATGRMRSPHIRGRGRSGRPVRSADSGAGATGRGPPAPQNRPIQVNCPHVIFLSLAALTVLAFLLVPFVNWLYAFLVLAWLEVVERRMFPLRIAA